MAKSVYGVTTSRCHTGRMAYSHTGWSIPTMAQCRKLFDSAVEAADSDPEVDAVILCKYTASQTLVMDIWIRPGATPRFKGLRMEGLPEQKSEVL